MANSAVVTGGVAVTAATLEPVINWSLNGFPHPIPEGVPFLVAAGIITAVHALYNLCVLKGWFPKSE